MLRNRDSQTEETKISVLINTRNRLGPLVAAIESVAGQDYSDWEMLVLDDASEDPIASRLGDRFKDLPVRYLRNETRMGVAGSRNRLVKEASGEILVTLDDDAILADSQALGRIARHFNAKPEVSVLAFKVRLETPNTTRLQLPFSKRALQADPTLANREGLASYYIGAGHAHRRSVFDQVGPYQHDLVFYGEELDWSYSAVAKGCIFLYVPDVEVIHRPQESVLGGVSNKEGANENQEVYFMVRNRLWIAYKHLPRIYLCTHLTVWIGYYAQRALWRGHSWSFIRGLASAIWGLRRLRRRPLGVPALIYLRMNYGRLWY